MVAASLKSFKILISKVRRWIKENPTEFLVLSIILVVGAILRIYKIDEYMTFLGDEGRDVIIVRRLLVYGDPVLIGPGTSIGNMYLGPLYYYMMAPALLLANFSPVGPAVMIALLGVFTIFFVWYVAKSWFGTHAAFFVSVLYTISPTTIIFSRSSWNPNIMPFFSLLTIWSIWKIYKEQNYKWLLVLGVSLSFVLQSHYLGVLLLPIIVIYWFLAFKVARSKKHTRPFLLHAFYSVLLFAVFMSPLLIFDLRHNFQNFRAMKEFVTTGRGNSFKGLAQAVEGAFYIYSNMFVRLVGGRNIQIGNFFSLVTTTSLFIYILKLKGKISHNLKIVIIWVVVGIIGLSFIEREIYDHYMGFLFTAPYLLLAWFIKQVESLVQSKSLKYFFLIAFLGFLFYVNFSNSPLRYNPPMQLARSMAVSQKILDEASSKKFNLAVLAEQNYEDGYRYFLELNGAEVLHADIWDKSTISDELFVVCEKSKEICDPTHDPKAEIVNFGWTKIEAEWEVNGVMVYKLAHNI